MTTKGLFSTPVYIERELGQSERDINQELMDKYYSMKKIPLRSSYNKEAAHDISVGENGIQFSENVVDDCPLFGKFLETSVNQYLKDLGFPPQPYMVKESWFTRTTKGKHAPVHNHADNDISGVYYVQTNEEDGPLVLKNPLSIAQGNYIYFLHHHQHGHHVMPLHRGQIILWPSMIDHSTYVNETTHERVSLSFNISIERYPFTLPKN